MRKSQEGAVVGGRKEEGGRRGLCSRAAMAAVSGEGRVKGQEDVLGWEAIGKEVVCVVRSTVAIGLNRR